MDRSNLMPRRQADIAVEPFAERSFGFSAWQGPIQRPQDRPHTHADVEWNLLIGGSARYFMSGRFQSLEPGRLAVFWGAIPHALVEYEPGSVMIWATLPIAWLIDWEMSDRFMSRMLSGQLIDDPGSARAGDAPLLTRWVEDIASGRPARRKAALLEARARLHRLDDDQSFLRIRPGPSAGGDQIERISAYVGRRFRDDFSTADVAAAVGLHPNYVMNLFKRCCGMSLWEYVTQLRISHAQRMLLMTQEKVTVIALDSGFQSPSRFYEAFGRIVGCTPRAYRHSFTDRS